MTQLFALLISWGIEIPVVLIILSKMKQFPNHRDIHKASIVAWLATLLTHPLAWEMNQVLIFYIEYPLRVGSIEIFVTITEAVVYAILLKLSWQKSLFLSVLANGASFFSGWLILKLL